MNTIGIPISTEQIPEGTGLVQSVECRGIENQYSKQFKEKPQPLDEPVTAQVVTFANGIRKVCCVYARDILGTGKISCMAAKEGSKETCIYSWNDKDKKKP